MAMAMTACSTRPRLCEMNPQSGKHFVEKLMVEIYDHFDGQDLIDVTFKLSNPNALVTAHRLVLSAASPYFKQLFKSEAGIRPLIEITSIDSDTFERFITFCYTGKTLITIDNVDRMLKAALILQLDDAVTSCVDFLIEHLTDYTLERAYILESETQSALLSEKILKHEIRNFEDIMHSDEYLNFDATKLQIILQSDDLNVPTEADAFIAVKRWYEHDASMRKQQLPEIISCLRLTQFDTNFIMTNIYPLPGCELLAWKIIAWVNVPSTREDTSLKFTNPRIADLAYMAFNIEGLGSRRTIFQYNKTADLWIQFTDIELDWMDISVIFMNDSLIFSGGLRDDIAINEVCNWNFKTKTFQQLPPMNEPRYRHSMVVLKYNIYAIGGLGANDETLLSVEIAVSFNGKIYVTGGNDGKDHLKSVECYDPTTNCWTQCADMNEHHSEHRALLYNGQIFVLGGRRRGSSSSIVERYDPQKNEWAKICSLSIGLQFMGSILIENQLWSVGGYNDDYYKNVVSVYDEQNNKWIDKAPMPMAACYYCFAISKSLLLTE